MKKDRLINILTVLSDGASDLNDIQKLINFDITECGIRRLLQAGKKDGYISSRLYTNNARSGCIALYTLTESGAEIVCSEIGYNIESIRMQLPPQHYAAHDALVTKVFRAIRREANDIGLTVLMADEYYLRYPLKGFPNKKKPLPDIYLKYAEKVNKTIGETFDVEIDNCTTPVRRLFSKLAILPHRVLILSSTRDRVHNITTSFMNIKSFIDKSTHKIKHYNDIEKQLYFATVEDFCSCTSGGVFGTVWQKIDRTKTMIPNNIYTTRL